MIRICRLNGPTTSLGSTVTSGDVTYRDSFFAISCASSAGVFPTATISSTSGIEMRPSGRTGTSIDSSGLRHTNIDSLSPGPITYCDMATSGGGGGGGGPLEQAPKQTPTSTPTTRPSKRLICPPPADAPTPVL